MNLFLKKSDLVLGEFVLLFLLWRKCRAIELMCFVPFYLFSYFHYALFLFVYLFFLLHRYY